MKVSAKVAATAPRVPTAFRLSRWKPSSAASAKSITPPATRISHASTASALASCRSIAAALRRRKPKAHEIGDLPEPRLPLVGADGYNILMAGIGGLGITSLAAILGMAAHLHNRQVRVLDQIGLAQKGGGVYSHLRIGVQGRELLRIPHWRWPGGSRLSGRHGGSRRRMGCR